MPIPNSLDEILALAEDPAYHRVAFAKILLRKDLVTEHAQLEEDLQRAMADDQRLNRDPRAPEIARDIERLEAEMEAELVAFKFRSVGHTKWADLMRTHPPTKAQLEQNRNLDHNPATFPVAAIAASLVQVGDAEGEVTEDWVRRLEAAIDESQFGQLWAKCLEANLGGDSPKSKVAGAILRLYGDSATTPPSGGSLDRGSLDDA